MYVAHFHVTFHISIYIFSYLPSCYLCSNFLIFLDLPCGQAILFQLCQICCLLLIILICRISISFKKSVLLLYIFDSFAPPIAVTMPRGTPDDPFTLLRLQSAVPSVCCLVLVDLLLYCLTFYFFKLIFSGFSH